MPLFRSICQLFQLNKELLLSLIIPKRFHVVCIWKTFPTLQPSVYVKKKVLFSLNTDIIFFIASDDLSIWGQHISLEPDNLPLPFLAPSFVAQHFTEAELSPAINSDSPWKEMWIYDWKRFSLCIVYICGALTHCNLTATTCAPVTTWPEGLRFCSSQARSLFRMD